MNTYINHCIFVQTTSPVENLKYSLEEADQSFRELMQSNVNTTNVDESAPPEVPRLFSQGLHQHLLISQITCQFTVILEWTREPIEKQVEIIKEKAKSFKACIDRFYGNSKLREFGIIVVTSSPKHDNQNTILNEMISKFTRLSTQNEPRMFELKYGYATKDNFIKGFTISQYEVRNKEIENAHLGQYVTLDQMPIDERGISFTIDVNNKTRFLDDLKSGHDSTEEQLLILEEMILTELSNLIK